MRNLMSHFLDLAPIGFDFEGLGFATAIVSGK
jgi:hypothetical protein